MLPSVPNMTRASRCGDATYLFSNFRQFHVVEYSEDYPEQIAPPVLFVSVAVSLHYLKHDGETPVTVQGNSCRELYTAVRSCYILYAYAPHGFCHSIHFMFLIMTFEEPQDYSNY